MDHIFFHCTLSKIYRVLLKTDFWSLFDEWAIHGFHLSNPLCTFLIAGLLWSMWCTRNKMAVEKKLPHNPKVILYDSISFMQRWGVSLKRKDQWMLEEVLDTMKSWLRCS